MGHARIRIIGSNKTWSRIANLLLSTFSFVTLTRHTPCSDQNSRTLHSHSIFGC